KKELVTDIAALVGATPADDQRPAAVSRAAEALFVQIEGQKGLLAVRESQMRSDQTIASLQESLQGLGDDLRQEVRALVNEAERDSTESMQRSVDEIAKSRLWLSLIAAASLLLAAVVVWLFVFRYVVARLASISRSMRSIAKGNLDAPIPAGTRDELG